ncbi:uncharacterized protein EI97DRAFT_39705 [Westerdykella ornata]|uniref:Uncharacterized protein n=1 Tax=Westerdykella ornata TaxID=318751 RepID=A0A6A6JIN4_WESOR|nr:uncharacterized protein EI97DRAFT_39705 [Westerdykella ornata]KAF2276431.1 hypothetical protein EI97DRAFT_39705 [Westerdykella ornata]
MDHWADPWADDVDTDTKPSPKPDIPTPQPGAPPTVLSEFLDDAQWGSVSQDEGWGEWTVEPSSRTPGELPERSSPHPEVNEPWRAAEEREDTEEHGNGISEASESGTTVHPDDNHEFPPPEQDNDISTRPSVSTSEASHTESVAESPRTSFEEERSAGKTAQNAPPTEHPPETVAEPGPGATEDALENRSEPQQRALQPDKEPKEASRPSALATTPIGPLLSELFPTLKKHAEPPPAQDDPIFSTSARKAWYRLTRQETMREYNSGGEDNNYVRVTWATSKIREDVNKIVSRWATEDRIAGRSHGGRVSFYWDQPTELPGKIAAIHVARKASASAPIAKQEIQSPVSDAPVAFSWSSAPAEQDTGEKRKSGMLQSQAPLIAPPVPAPTTAIKEASRHSLEQSAHDVPALESAQALRPVSPSASEQGSLPHEIDAPRASIQEDNQQEQRQALDLDQIRRSTDTSPPDISDDEDWGEMVQSPTQTNPPPNASFFESTIPSETGATPSTGSSGSTPTISRHAAPIVRLQGIVSPTSAVFGAKPLIPLHAEQGPIGPHILRKTKDVPLATPEKPKASRAEPSQPAADAWADADFSIFDSAPARTPPVVAPRQPVPSVPPARGLPSRSDTPSAISPLPPQSRRSEDDEVVRSIISGLPDLSYMLKK